MYRIVLSEHLVRYISYNLRSAAIDGDSIHPYILFE